MRCDNWDSSGIIDSFSGEGSFSTCPTGTHTGIDNPLRPRCNRCIEKKRIHVLMRIKNVDLSKVFDTSDIKDDPSDRLSRRIEEIWHLIDEDA